MSYRLLPTSCLALLALVSTGCPGPVTRPDAGTSTYRIGGSVSGLLGSGLVLRSASGEERPIAQNGAFAFTERLPSGAEYAVTVSTQPNSPRQLCTVASGAGQVGSADVTNIEVTCVTEKFQVGGTVTGLSGSGLVLSNSAVEDLSVTASGAFHFPTRIETGAAYKVTVKVQPSSPAQTCVVTGGSGTVVSGDVTSISVNCTVNSYTVGGTVAGLAGTLVLQNNGGNDLSLTSTGTFAFSTPLTPGQPYEVTVLTQPGTPSQTCVVANGTGTMGAVNVTNVAITCTTNTFTIGGSITGLEGTLVLRNNGGDGLTRTASGAFTFATPVSSGQSYSVTVFTQPAGQTCTVKNGSGSAQAANITQVEVECVTNSYTVGGTLSGLTGSLVLQNNGASDLTLTANGPFTFSAPVLFGQPYAVTVLTPPTGQDCTVSTDGSGTMGAGNVTGIQVTCLTRTHTLGGALTGLVGILVIQNNLGDDLSLSVDGPFTFPTALAEGESYSVTVLTQPVGHQCNVSDGSGSMGGASVTEVAVSCIPNTYAVGGTVSGLSGTLVLQNNGADELTLSGDGPFSFATPVSYGQPYLASILTPPSGQTCVLSDEQGTVGAGVVADIAVTCAATTYTIGGTVGGLVGTVKLKNNGGDEISVSNSGNFAFTTGLISGANYAVTVSAQPRTQTCTATAETGQVASLDVTSVVVTCVTSSYNVGGTVSGLAGTVVLKNNGGDDLTLTQNGAFRFETTQLTADTYSISISSHPQNGSCTLTQETGTIGTSDVTDVVVSCVTTAFTLGGTVSGLSGTVVLQNDAGDDLSLSSDGAFTFPTGLANGDRYNVTVLTQPSDESCLVGNAAGTITSQDVSDVVVACVPHFMLVRVGEGTAALSNGSTAVFLEERRVSDGSLVRTLNLPIAASGAQQEFTLSGTATSEGGLSRSADGKFVSLAGYSVAPGTLSVGSTTATLTPRVVARVSHAGAIDTSTLLGGSYSGASPRGATSLDGSAFWTSGANSGVQYVQLGGTTPSLISNTIANLRHLHIFAGQLYASAASGTNYGVASVGTGTPTTGSQATTLLSGFPTSGSHSPYGFAVLDAQSATAGVDTIYLSHDTLPATPGADKVHVQKWSLNGSTWTQQTAFAPTLTSTTGIKALGLAAIATPAGVRVVVSTNENPPRVLTFLDSGADAPPATVLTTGAANTAFRGVAFSPAP